MTRYRAIEVQTGWPTTSLLACNRCGVLLWNVDEHYAHAHPDVEEGATDGG